VEGGLQGCSIALGGTLDVELNRSGGGGVGHVFQSCAEVGQLAALSLAVRWLGGETGRATSD
jgi:hypothetical protein